MRFIGMIFGLLALLVMGAVGYIAYVMLTPITTANVQSRMSMACYVGMGAMIFDQLASPQMKGNPFDACMCLVDGLVKANGADKASRFGETMRKVLVFRIKAMASGDKSAPATGAGVSTAEIDAFSSASTIVANACTKNGNRSLR